MEAGANPWIRKALAACDRLNLMADKGEAKADDDGCAVLFGVIRDCAYKIRGRAERELNLHKRQGRCRQVGGEHR